MRLQNAPEGHAVACQTVCACKRESFLASSHAGSIHSVKSLSYAGNPFLFFLLKDKSETKLSFYIIYRIRISV